MRLKYLLGLLVLVLAYTACKKEDKIPDSQYYIQFKLDGELVQIKSLDDAHNSNVVGLHSNPNSAGDYFVTSLSAQQDLSVTNKNVAVLIAGHESPIQVGITYTTDSTNIPGAIKSDGVILSYTNNEGIMYQCTSLPDFIGLPSNGRMRITEVSTDAVSGTFSGLYYNTDFTEHLTITEGEFKVKLNQ